MSFHFSVVSSTGFRPVKSTPGVPERRVLLGDLMGNLFCFNFFCIPSVFAKPKETNSTDTCAQYYLAKIVNICQAKLCDINVTDLFLAHKINGSYMNAN